MDVLQVEYLLWRAAGSCEWCRAARFRAGDFEMTVKYQYGFRTRAPETQALGLEALPRQEESMFRTHSRWHWFRQDLFPGQEQPGEQTWPAIQ